MTPSVRAAATRLERTPSRAQLERTPFTAAVRERAHRPMERHATPIVAERAIDRREERAAFRMGPPGAVSRCSERQTFHGGLDREGAIGLDREGAIGLDREGARRCSERQAVPGARTWTR